jgi:hypothetical protein
VLNLCTGHGTALMELIAVLQELTAHEPKLEQAAELVRKNEVWRLTGCPEKLHAMIDADTGRSRPLKDTLRVMLEQWRA